MTKGSNAAQRSAAVAQRVAACRQNAPYLAPATPGCPEFRHV